MVVFVMIVTDSMFVGVGVAMVCPLLFYGVPRDYPDYAH